MNIIIPLCGISKRFTDNGYTEPKCLIKIFEKEMIIHVLDCIEQINNNIFIIYHKDLDNFNFLELIHQYNNKIVLICLDKRTRGAAETVYLGIDKIINSKIYNYDLNTLIIDCDTIYNTNIIKKIKNINNNSVIYFEDNEDNPIYSYILFNENNIITNIIEKEKISNYANTGAYYFNNIYELYDACKFIIDNNITFKNEYYMSCVIKYMIDNKYIFNAIKINKNYYISVGTPYDLEKYINNTNAYLFDLDGTIVKTDNIYFKVWYDILLEYNIVLTLNIYKQYIQGHSDSYALDNLNINKDYYNLDDISFKKDILFIKYSDNIELIEGAYNFIKKIKKTGNRICIVTNCNKLSAECIINKTKLYKYIDYLITSNDVDKPKPNPDPYIKAMKLLNVQSNKCIIFEDSKTGLISALSTFPKKVIGINSNDNYSILSEMNIKHILNNYNDINMHLISETTVYDELYNMIYKSLINRYDIKSIDIDNNKLKGGYISDVIKIKINLTNNNSIDTVLKYENTYNTAMTKMAYSLNLFNREYYFYENISSYININIPKYIGTIKDNNFISKGIILENLNNNCILNLDLNKESIDVSLKIIEECAKMHSLFWNKPLSLSFKDLKKHNDLLFNPVWSNFIKEKWPLFINKWNAIIPKNILTKFEYIINNFTEIQEYLSNDNLTLCHGDIKSANIFYNKTQNGYIPYFIDWQYIIQGKGIQDIVFFMIESFDIEHITTYAALFKNYYYIKLKEFGVQQYTIEQYNKDFEYSIYYFPIFVAIWFGTTLEDELIDSSFPFIFIKKLIHFMELFS